MHVQITLDYIWVPANRMWTIVARARRDVYEDAQVTLAMDGEAWRRLDDAGRRKVRIDMLNALEDEMYRQEQGGSA